MRARRTRLLACVLGALLLARACPAVPDGTALPDCLRTALEDHLAQSAAIEQSLPAHPLAPALLEECCNILTQGPAPVANDSRTALRVLAKTFGDRPFGMYAIGTYAQRHGAADGFLAAFVHAYPDSRAAAIAADFVPQETLRDLSPVTRVAQLRRIEAAASLPDRGEAIAGILKAWADCSNPSIATIAARRAEALLATSAYAPLRDMLAITPVPARVLQSVARFLKTARPGIWPPATTAVASDPILALACAVRAFQQDPGAAEQVDALLADAFLPGDVRVYFGLLSARRLIGLLRLDNALHRLDTLEALPEAAPYAAVFAELRGMCRAGVQP